jgi:predicted glycoside hydrolase/deacetylase ChbG (UPF0249 family)
MGDDRPPPLLVVVADDGGIDVARNRGIVDAVRRGIVRAVSVLARGEALDDLVDRLRDLDEHQLPEIGLHLCLTEGPASAGPAPGLTDASGAFTCSKRALWERALAGDVPADAVRREALAQLERLDAAGLPPTRVDGHQHVHLLPGVRDGLADALDAAPAVRWVRLGAPVVAAHARQATFPRLPPARVGTGWEQAHAAGHVAQAAYGTLADEARDLLRSGRRSADAFGGLDLVVEPTTAVLRRELEAALRTAPHGVIELMTHPGECEEGSVPFSADPARSAEREALCGEGLPELLDELGLRLGRFADAESRT